MKIIADVDRCIVEQQLVDSRSGVWLSQRHWLAEPARYSVAEITAADVLWLLPCDPFQSLSNDRRRYLRLDEADPSLDTEHQARCEICEVRLRPDEFLVCIAGGLFINGTNCPHWQPCPIDPNDSIVFDGNHRAMVLHRLGRLVGQRVYLCE